ncbi:MFS transporter [Streptomyces sp. enrichment culture]|uniref:MFS transporter n=1 Tax=Streptomyces sp. enrichment culture TaxID=1795815 RepID=UPI003F574CFC
MLNAYRSLLTIDHLPSLFACSVASRLTVTTLPIAESLLIVEWTGSFAQVGIVTGVQAGAQALSAPLRGRAADRGSVPWVVTVSALSFAGSLAGLAAMTAWLPASSWPLAVLVAVLAGLSTSPVPQVSRAVWPRLVGEEHLARLYTLDATGQDAAATLGPLLASLTAAALSPAVSVGTCAVLAVGGSLAFALAYHRSSLAARPLHQETGTAGAAGTAGTARTQPAHGAAGPAGGTDGEGRTRGADSGGGGVAPEPPGAPAGRRLLLAERGFLPVLLVAMCVMASIYTINLSVVAYSTHTGQVGLSGVLICVWTVGSLVGGLTLGATSWELNHTGLLLALAAGMGALAAVLPPAREATPVAVIGLVLFAGGLVLGPNIAANNTQIAEVAPEHRRTEAFGWLQTATTGGSALSMMLAGALLDTAGPAAAVGAGTGLALLAVLVRCCTVTRPRAGHSAGAEASGPPVAARPAEPDDRRPAGPRGFALSRSAARRTAARRQKRRRPGGAR